MGTPEQFQEMLDLLKQQFASMQTLQTENARLREGAAQMAPVEPAAEASAGSSRCKTQKPDRPTVDANIDDREWALFLDRWDRYKDMCYLSATEAERIRERMRVPLTSIDSYLNMSVQLH